MTACVCVCVQPQVSKEPHVLVDLLARVATCEVQCELALVVSNHADLRAVRPGRAKIPTPEKWKRTAFFQKSVPQCVSRV